MAIRIRSGDEAAFARYLVTKSPVERSDLALGFDPSLAVEPRLFVEGQEFYPAMLEDIRRAESSVHIIQFGIRPGQVASRFSEAMIDRVRSGVPVRLIVDSRGSRPDGESRALFAELVAGGVEVFVNRPFDLRVDYGPLGSVRGRRWNLANLAAVDHRKVVIVDGRVCWLGTAGIEDRFYDGRHHDVFVRLEGPVLHQFQAVFLANYRWHGGVFDAGEIPALFPDCEYEAGAVPAVVLHNAPGKFRPISRAIVDLIGAARHSLDIMNPYIAEPVVFRRMIEAARRGVKVRLIAPPGRHTWTTGYVRLYHHKAMASAGVEMWTYPVVAHAKAFVRDGKDVLIGSCNLETWSLRRFFEIDLRLQSPELAEAFRASLFDPDIAESVPARPPHGLREHVLSRLFYLASPFL